VAEPTKTLENVDAVDKGADAPGELGPLLFGVLCGEDLSQPPVRYSLSRVAEVGFGRARPPGAEIRGKVLRIGIADPFASSSHARLEQNWNSAWHVRDEDSKNGTLVNSERVRPGELVRLRDGDLLEIGHTFFLFRDSAHGNADRDAAIASDGSDALTLNPEWELELSKADKLARTSHEILILGESGAGKEVLARFLHDRSGRTGALVNVNCGALAENLLEDELFGHVRGAFSGAQADRQGLVRAAHEGTLFLDEIGDMPLGLQVKFLRVLEDHKVRPIGTEREFSVDVRVVAATNRNLEDLVAQGKFRGDLLARLGLLPIRVPALRDRREDLGLLIRAILRDAPLERVRFKLDALRLVLRYPWPLNIRELRQALLAAVDLAGGDGAGPVVIARHHLPDAVQEPPPTSVSTALSREGQAPAPRRRDRELTDSEREVRDRIVDLLRRTDGNISAVAREMGKGRTQIHRWITLYGIDVAAVRSSVE
jgi:transcriptional regulator with PAS, ATPase and Fis domain